MKPLIVAAPLSIRSRRAGHCGRLLAQQFMVHTGGSIFPLHWPDFLIALFLSTHFAVPSSACGVTGHRAIVEVATCYLSAQARDQIRVLIDRKPEALSDLTMWADEIAELRPKTDPGMRWKSLTTAADAIANAIAGHLACQILADAGALDRAIHAVGTISNAAQNINPLVKQRSA